MFIIDVIHTFEWGYGTQTSSLIVYCQIAKTGLVSIFFSLQEIPYRNHFGPLCNDIYCVTGAFSWNSRSAYSVPEHTNTRVFLPLTKGNCDIKKACFFTFWFDLYRAQWRAKIDPFVSNSSNSSLLEIYDLRSIQMNKQCILLNLEHHPGLKICYFWNYPTWKWAPTP